MGNNFTVDSFFVSIIETENLSLILSKNLFDKINLIFTFYAIVCYLIYDLGINKKK